MKICFLTKKEKYGVKEAISFTKKTFGDVDIFYEEHSIKFPEKIKDINYDIIISYMSPWIVPEAVLHKTKKWNINFHPGPPAYPGIGCFNFALYNSAKQFGTTAHIMNSKVDTGKIIGVKRFSMRGIKNVYELSMQTYIHQLELYRYIIDFISENHKLPISKEKWKRKPYTRNELEKLATIDIHLSKEENDNKIRSTYYPGKPAPFIKFQGNKYEYNPDR